MKVAQPPVLITHAAPSYEEQFAARKRRYAGLMGARLFLFVLAAVFYPVSPWLAVAMLALSVPLPWMAVLIANDSPVRRTEDAHQIGSTTAPVPQLEACGHVVVDMT